MKSQSFKPQLAMNFSDKAVKYPCLVQPKLRGIRAIWNGKRFYSRRGERFADATTKHIVDTLRSILPTKAVLDGEFYVHGWEESRINSAIGVNRQEPNMDTPVISYVVFDAPSSSNTVFERLAFLNAVLPTYDYKTNLFPVSFVPTFTCDTKETGDQLYARFLALGFEGAMYRLGNCPYINPRRQDNRSPYLLKRKERKDDIFTVVGRKVGDPSGNRRETLGALVCITSRGVQFDVGSGFNDDELHTYWNERMPARIKVEFEKYSKDGVPLKPVFICEET